MPPTEKTRRKRGATRRKKKDNPRQEAMVRHVNLCLPVSRMLPSGSARLEGGGERGFCRRGGLGEGDGILQGSVKQRCPAYKKYHQ